MIEHIEQACTSTPHVLIAYAFVLYMALFNGGRWIRAELLKAQWGGGLDFWYFPGPDNGEGVKNEFKARLIDVQGLLTVEQRRDIVREAQDIFRNLLVLVEELDGLVAERVTEGVSVTEHYGLTDSVVKHLLPLGMVELLGALVSWIGRSRWFTWLFFWIRHETEIKDKTT
jgi:heme oxygenase